MSSIQRLKVVPACVEWKVESMNSFKNVTTVVMYIYGGDIGIMENQMEKKMGAIYDNVLSRQHLLRQLVCLRYQPYEN